MRHEVFELARVSSGGGPEVAPPVSGVWEGQHCFPNHGVEISDVVNEDGDAGPCSALGSMQGGAEVLGGEVGATAVDAAALRLVGRLVEVRRRPSSHEPGVALGDDAAQGDFAEVCAGLRGA